MIVQFFVTRENNVAFFEKAGRSCADENIAHGSSAYPAELSELAVNDMQKYLTGCGIFENDKFMRISMSD